MLFSTSAYASPWAPAVPSTLLKALTLPKTPVKASSFPLKASVRKVKVLCSPSLPTFLRRSSLVSPIVAKAFFDFSVGFTKPVITPLNPVTASSAETPKRVKVAIFAPSSSKLIPSCAPKPTIRPRVGARLSASRLPSLTIAVKVSVASAAVRPSLL